MLHAIALVAAVLAAAPQGQAWTSGRATFYGDEPWYWDIHHGSCGMGYRWPDQGTGWDIVALSDQFPGYSGSCQRCYEVRCANQDIQDGYGQSLGRNGMCRDSEASVVVTVSDTCPCNYANNAYSNKRWCCGDMNHMDLSVYAFTKLADKKWGVIPVEYREVDCSHQPSKKASGGEGVPVFPTMDTAKTRPHFNWGQYFSGGGYLTKTGSWYDLGTYLSQVGSSSGSGSGDSGSSDSGSSSSSDGSSGGWGSGGGWGGAGSGDSGGSDDNNRRAGGFLGSILSRVGGTWG